MIRHSCAACGRPINRTDHFFETSDGNLCQDCLARLASGGSSRRGAVALALAAPHPPWAILPELVPHRFRQS